MRTKFLEAATTGFALLYLAAACSRAPVPPVDNSASTTQVTDDGVKIVYSSNPNPPQAGKNAFQVILKGADDAPISDATVNTVFYMPAMPSMNMPEMRSTFALASAGNGTYRGDGELIMSGTWNVTINVLRAGEKLGSARFSVIAK
jgi:YtkA-like protein